MRILRKCMVLLSLAFASLPAFGQTCAGFSDVPASHPFCANIEWIKNRAVTGGCASNPLRYCPDDSVPRTQMAAFMNRLGNALTPFILRTIDAGFNGTYDPSAVGCISAPFPITDPVDYPRQASFAATLMNFNAASPKTVQGQLVYSTDSGATWLSTGDAIMWQTIDPAERTTLALVGGPLDLNVGSTYTFAIRTTTNAPAVSVSGECQLNVRIESRTSSTSPF